MTRSFADVWTIAEKVEGWLLPEQGRALYDAARRVPVGTAAVEIGSHRGKSAVIIAMGLPEGVRLTAVDPFDDPRWGGGPESLTAFTANVEQAGVSDRVDLFRGISKEASAAWNGQPVGFLWVDGAHDLESTLTDFDGWRPHMAPHSYIYVHDAFSAVGTTRAILRRFWFSKNVRYVGAARTLAKFEVGDFTLAQRLIAGIKLTRRLFFFARMIAIKLSRRRGLHGLERFFMLVPNEPLI
jgi:predicted O-methyltransferase YrrM